MKITRAALLALAISTGLLAATAGEPSLVEAVKARSPEGVQSLLDEGADVNAADNEGMTALHWAARLNDLETARLLLGSGARADVSTPFEITPLYLACMNGNAPLIEALLEAGAGANAARGENETVLMTAARTGNADAVKVLLKHGADVHAKETWRGQTALIFAAAENHPEAVRALIEAGADVNAASIGWSWPDKRPERTGNGPLNYASGGLSALMYAAREGALESARLLVEAGAKLDATDPDGMTALMAAVFNGHYDLAAMLVDVGANVNDGSLYVAIDMKNFPDLGARPAPQTNDARTAFDIIQLLLEKGADPNHDMQVKMLARQTLGGEMGAGRVLFRAARSHDVETMKLLFDKGADVNLTGKNETTALMAAASVPPGANDPETQEQVIAALQLCIDQGADINAADDKGTTVTHMVARAGLDHVIQFLADHGAKLDVKNKTDHTPLDLALGRGPAGFGGAPPVHESTAALLRKLLGLPEEDPDAI